MHLIDQETLNQLLSFAAESTKNLSGFGLEVVNEVLAFELFKIVVNSLTFLVPILVANVISKFLNNWSKAVPENAYGISLIKTVVWTLVAGYIMAAGSKNLIDAGKIMLAPKMFIIEKGADLFKNRKVE